ncbi:MBL fold metallo-hydrolase [Rhizobium sp. VS19-DR104.2]|uniref:MBL fold metallo-hydrolase n=1 Tax=unclassified Rhizobium TaxID=2613769 RepID=UPI001ADBD326|nr:MULTISPECIES: MBL fold metallo-hydrolase [unclassified Rhizobium]MBO9183807.1 MBL fold metallo-hydrolase [Rhizobium sp. E27B/91]MBZ5762553.1 MBL fold metallo-hydrolase [Rhizobium sp. VS19-DR96]MBZ5768551.1 MBL fold metallo-hydrolase [Rhizobium sp. VS19-DR129.2]MBZ5776422.1 MBL fold metallo-hydrolase [Rhizobium sp. VS19-DRK62.2]MBZ5787278.1 MBL fold metallo-hydrolase [Rhizobium sp. VS19-DR121]
MFETEIIRIPILPLKMVNAHVIRCEAGCILVDAGIPGSEGKIGQVLGRHGLSFRDIKLIVVTHAHTDHAGSAARLRALSGAPILAHADDVDFYTRGRPMTYCPTGLVGKLFFRTPAPHQPYEGFEPDMLMTNGETVNLLNFGVDGLVRHTAGHTAGSISVELGSQDVLVGDLLASGILIGGVAFTGRAIRPPFEDDPHAVARELNRMVEGGKRRFYMGHGGPLGPEEVLRHTKRLSHTASQCGQHGNCNHTRLEGL